MTYSMGSCSESKVVEPCAYFELCVILLTFYDYTTVGFQCIFIHSLTAVLYLSLNLLASAPHERAAVKEIYFYLRYTMWYHACRCLSMC